MNENVGSVLLGTIIANAESGAVFPEGISAAMFELPRDRVIFTVASGMILEGTLPNLVLLTDRLQKTGNLVRAGGADYLASLTSLPGLYANQIKHYGEALKRQVKVKEVVVAVNDAAERLKSPSESLELIVPELLEKLSNYNTGDEKQAFRFTRLDSIEIKPASWIVKNFIEDGSFCSLYGDPGAGKSFLAIELAACIATGTPFYGIPVKPGAVIYLAGEGHSGLARRFKAWSIARGVSLNDAPLYLSAGSISLIEPSTMGQVCLALEKLIKEIGNPSLVILDTWSRVLGGDDSSPSDAAAGVAALDGLRARFGNFAALVVHHEGHLKGRGRGWSGLRAAVDMEYRAERGADGILRIECTKAKDTGIMEPMAFQFIGVELPIRNESGEPVTSAVLNRIGWEPVPKAKKEPIAGKNQARALDIYRRLATGGQVTVEAWKTACFDTGMDRRRFSEIKNSLQESGEIIINNLIVSERAPPSVPLLYNGDGSDGHLPNVRIEPVSDISDISDSNSIGEPLSAVKELAI